MVDERGLPYGQHQYIDVTFNSTANADTIIRHQLKPDTPAEVDYQVVRKEQACDVYENTALDYRVWGNGYVVLRATVASAKVTLLLTTRR